MSPKDPPRPPAEKEAPTPARDAAPSPGRTRPSGADATQEPDWVNDADRPSQEPQEDAFLGPPRKVPPDDTGD